MQYDLQKIEYVKAVVLHGYKADVNVQVQIKLKSALDTENIQVKLVSNKKGFNQIDKRWLSNYKEMWNIPDNIYKLSWFAINKTLILSDIIKRRGKFSAEWVLVAQKTGKMLVGYWLISTWYYNIIRLARCESVREVQYI